MKIPATEAERCAVIAALVEAADKPFGRTALMKFMYFLQTLKAVPLGYRFTLYTYGPFDSTALDDLDYAESLGAIQSKMITNPNGFGYEIKPGDPGVRGRIKAKGEVFLSEYRKEIQWVITNFAKYSPSTLELLSTIVYADREATAKKKEVSAEELTQQVLKVKPRFPFPQAHSYVKLLDDMKLLHSLTRQEEQAVAA